MIAIEGVLAANVAVLAALLRYVRQNGKVCNQHDKMCETINEIAQDVAFIKGRLKERDVRGLEFQ